MSRQVSAAAAEGTTRQVIKQASTTKLCLSSKKTSSTEDRAKLRPCESRLPIPAKYEPDARLGFRKALTINDLKYQTATDCKVVTLLVLMHPAPQTPFKHFPCGTCVDIGALCTLLAPWTPCEHLPCRMCMARWQLVYLSCTTGTFFTFPLHDLLVSTTDSLAIPFSCTVFTTPESHGIRVPCTKDTHSVSPKLHKPHMPYLTPQAPFATSSSHHPGRFAFLITALAGSTFYTALVTLSGPCALLWCIPVRQSPLRTPCCTASTLLCCSPFLQGRQCLLDTRRGTADPGGYSLHSPYHLHTSCCNKATVSTLLCCALCRPPFLHYSCCSEGTLGTVCAAHLSCKIDTRRGTAESGRSSGLDAHGILTTTCEGQAR
eukprot:1160636-Pelagomonas_calceolata.AAC.6